MQNSSSRAITTSTASKESRSKSSLNLAEGVTLEWVTYNYLKGDGKWLMKFIQIWASNIYLLKVLDDLNNTLSDNLGVKERLK